MTATHATTARRAIAWLLIGVLAWAASWPRAVICVGGDCAIGEVSGPAAVRSACCAIEHPEPEPEAPTEPRDDADCCVALDLPCAQSPTSDAATTTIGDDDVDPVDAPPPLCAPWSHGRRGTGPPPTHVVPRPPWVRLALLARATVVLTV